MRVVLSEGEKIGHGECVPYTRYGETPESVAASLQDVKPQIEAGLNHQQLSFLMPAGAARNALDCALWDLRAKLEGKPVWQLAGLPQPQPVITAYTISLAPHEQMAQATHDAGNRPVLKVKLGGEGDEARIHAVRQAAPEAVLIADANEAWTEHNFIPLMQACATAGFSVIEQPLPAHMDAILAEMPRLVPVFADESLHNRRDLARVADLYDGINIKLDKTGGLTEAINLVREAQAYDLDIMVGCMVGTSLAMAPALLLAPYASYVDLDGPLLLARDRDHELIFDGNHFSPALPALWG